MNSNITCNNITKRYHLECESPKYDGIILVRVFEYGTQIAIDNGEKGLYKAKFTFPESGVLLLREGKEIADKATIEIVLPDNKEVSYDIPLIKVSDYSIDEIFSKKMYMLIPFYIFNFESKLPAINSSEAQIDDLLGKYEKIFQRLKNEVTVHTPELRIYCAVTGR